MKLMYIKGISTTHWWGGAVCSDLVFRLYLIHSSLSSHLFLYSSVVVLQGFNNEARSGSQSFSRKKC